MRIILSRKGFDSGYGQVASPILPDGRMISFPIPAARSAKTYGDISFDGAPLSNLVQHLTGNGVRAGHKAHLDPDLSAAALPRREGWRPAFGQEKAAQRHLQNEGVQPGDLFLFFGWMRQTELRDGVLSYERKAPDIHCLFGWLQIDHMIAIDDRIDEVRRDIPWLADHPHVNAHAAPGNAVYVGTKRLIVGGRDLGVPGAGAFERFHPGLRLTAQGTTRSVWDLPSWFCPDTGPTMSYHRDPTRWERTGERVRMKAVAKGQEFVMDVSNIPGLEPWLSGLFAGAR